MRGLLTLLAVVALAACGPAVGIPAGVNIELDPDAASNLFTDADVIVVADAARRFPPAEPALLVDVELALANDDSAHAHVVMTDTTSHASVPFHEGDSLHVKLGVGCCIGAQTQSAILIDAEKLVAAGFTAAPVVAGRIAGTDLSVQSDGLRAAPSLTSCGSSAAIALRFSDGDQSIVLGSGDRGTLKLGGHALAVVNGSSNNVQARCTDTHAGDIASWIAVDLPVILGD